MNGVGGGLEPHTEQKICGEVIATGSELMLGRMVDTNSAWISEELGRIGVPTVRHTTVGDDLPRLSEAFRRAWAENQIIVVSGGLGPTEDDLTRAAAARAFDLELEFHEDLAQWLREVFQRRGFIMTDNNLRQAWLPCGSIVVPNDSGTAPGFALADDSRLMVFLPGVPSELKLMFKNWFLPTLKERLPVSDRLIKTVVMRTAGLGESVVDDLVGDLIKAGSNPTIGLLASPDVSVRILISAEGRDDEELAELLKPTVAELEKRLAGHVYGYGEISLAQATAALLKKTGYSLTILDAITQGRLSGSLAPSLDLENWGGAQDLPWQPTLSGVIEILRLYAPDSAALQNEENSPARRHRREIRLITTARPDLSAATPPPGEAALVFECAVQGEAVNNGQALTRKFNLGGESGRVLDRAAALSTFHLWQVLSECAAHTEDSESAPLRPGRRKAMAE